MTTEVTSGQKKKQMWKTEQKVMNYVDKFHMIQPGDGVVVGVSGGADSVCLLQILGNMREKWKISLTAVHVHHQLRGKEADEDEGFVLQLCKSMEIPCYSIRKDVRQAARVEKTGLEEAGRNVRYQCFEQICRKTCSSKIALAHHQDDLAETMLHHLARGTGVSGLCSMRPVTGNRIRPLLCLEKQEILDYLEAAGQPYRTDSSNLEDAYTRNRIRHHVIGKLKEEVNPQAVKHMAQFSQELNEMEELLEQLVKEKKKQYLTRQASVILYDDGLRQEPELLCRRILLEGMKELSGQQKNFTRLHVEEVCALWDKQVGAGYDLPYGLQAKRTYEGIRLGKKSMQEERKKEEFYENVPVSLKENGICQVFSIGDLTMELRLLSEDFVKIQEKKYTKWFDYDRIKQTLVIRHRQPGDRICLYDKGGSKKLKDYLIDRKIPAETRDRLWLLADGSQIVWIIGDRISAAYKVTAESKRILQADIKGGSTHE